MQVEEKALFNTKMLVPRFDAMAVQNSILKHCPNIGYELALSKSKEKHKFDRKCKAVCFFIDRSGYLEFFEVYAESEMDDLREYSSYPEEEINYEVTLTN